LPARTPESLALAETVRVPAVKCNVAWDEVMRRTRAARGADRRWPRLLTRTSLSGISPATRLMAARATAYLGTVHRAGVTADRSRRGWDGVRVGVLSPSAPRPSCWSD